MASSGIEKSSDHPRTFWGWASVVAICIPAPYVLAAAGLVTGTIEYAKGGKFWDGAEKPFDIGEDVCRKVWEWSDENSDYLTRIAINNVMSAATGAAGQEIRHHGHSGGGGS